MPERDVKAGETGAEGGVAEAPPQQRPYPIAYRQSPHEPGIESYFSEPGRTLIADWTPLQVDWSLVVCFVNRSGSTWLVDLLAASGLAGRGGEYINADVVARQSDQHGYTSFDDYFRGLAKRTARGRCFTLKAGIGQLHYLRKLRVIPDLFPNTRFILCRRRDIAGQALSFIKAAHTLEWHRYAGQDPVPFDYDQVTNRHLHATIKSIADQYAEFERFFATFGIDYVPVVYEDLVADTAAEMMRIFTALGVKIENPQAMIAGARTSVMQRDEASERRLRRFHSAMNRR